MLGSRSCAIVISKSSEIAGPDRRCRCAEVGLTAEDGLAHQTLKQNVYPDVSTSGMKTDQRSELLFHRSRCYTACYGFTASCGQSVDSWRSSAPSSVDVMIIYTVAVDLCAVSVPWGGSDALLRFGAPIFRWRGCLHRRHALSRRARPVIASAQRWALSPAGLLRAPAGVPLSDPSATHGTKRCAAANGAAPARPTTGPPCEDCRAIYLAGFRVQRGEQLCTAPQAATAARDGGWPTSTEMTSPAVPDRRVRSAW